MADLLDTLLFDEPSPEQREELQARFEEQPDLARAWAHWRAVRAQLQDRLEERVSDRRLLVLYVLAEDGYDEALTTSEQAALEAARDDIAHAIETLPALEQVVERIREERTDFEEVWNAEIDDLSVQSAAGERTDRAPRAPTSQDESASRWRRRFALVSLVVGFAVGIGLYWFQDGSMTTVTVPEGEVQTVELGSGSTARLVGAAQLTHPTSASETEPYHVTLEEGRAFFDVQRRAEGASFVVKTPTATASVLGTQFGVATQADTTEVVLASGRVRVESAEEKSAESIVLNPGQKSWVAKGKGPSTPTPADLTTALDWTGLFIFRSVPMETVVDRLSRRYDVSVTVAGALAQEPVTGTFEQNQPVQQVLEALAATLEAEVQRVEGGYRLAPR